VKQLGHNFSACPPTPHPPPPPSTPSWGGNTLCRCHGLLYDAYHICSMPAQSAHHLKIMHTTWWVLMVLGWPLQALLPSCNRAWHGSKAEKSLVVTLASTC